MRLLWIEDKLEHIRRFVGALENRGHDVVVNASGEEALETLYQAHVQHRPFDVILLDIMLPKGDGSRIAEATRPELMGIEILRHLETEGCRTPVVIITAIADAGVMDSIPAKYPFVAAILKKPVRMDDLREAIEMATRTTKGETTP